MELVGRACKMFKRQNARFSAWVETPSNNELWNSPAFKDWRYAMHAISVRYTHCNPLFGGLDIQKPGCLSGSGICWPFPEGVDYSKYGCQCKKGRVHKRPKGSDLADAAIYPEPTARAFAKAVSRSRRAVYFRRADMSLMNRGDAAAATWIFSGDESRQRRGRDADIPWRRVAATPRPRRGYSAEVFL